MMPGGPSTFLLVLLADDLDEEDFFVYEKASYFATQLAAGALLVTLEISDLILLNSSCTIVSRSRGSTSAPGSLHPSGSHGFGFV
jgi:hypothetical protein